MKIPGVDYKLGEESQVQIVQPLDLKPAQAEADYWRTKAADIETVAVNFICEDEKQFGDLVELLGRVKKARTSIKSAFDGHALAAKNFLSELNGLQGGIVRHLDNSESALKRISDRYLYQKQLAEAEAQKKAEAEAAAFQQKLDDEATERGVEPIKIETAPVTKPAVEKVKTESASVTIKTETVAEIKKLNSRALLDYVVKVKGQQYQKLAESALKIAIKSGIRKMAGVEFKEVRKMAHRKTR